MEGALKKTTAFKLNGQEDFQFRMDGEEFRYIRERYGISRRQLGENAEKLLGKPVSSKTIYNWESKKQLNYLQIHILRNSMPEDMFIEARKEWEKTLGTVSMTMQ
ncbi:MAG: hypothetical protein QG635_2079 [Bacteroidota bacterium]|nr:hypothetical protein [Bacteroidota bacterium]